MFERFALVTPYLTPSEKLEKIQEIIDNNDNNGRSIKIIENIIKN